MSEQKLQI